MHFHPDRDPLLSRPVRVHWAGWESDTLKLQQAGWEVSAREDIAYRRMSLALRHQGYNMRAVTSHADFPYWEPQAELLRSLQLPVQFMASDISVVVPLEPSRADFRAVDCSPRYRWGGDYRQGLDKYAHFAGARAGKELILPEEDVNDLLSRILDMQSKARSDHFLDLVKRSQQGPSSGLSLEAVPERKFEAQIISLAERRMAA